MLETLVDPVDCGEGIGHAAQGWIPLIVNSCVSECSSMSNTDVVHIRQRNNDNFQWISNYLTNKLSN